MGHKMSNYFFKAASGRSAYMMTEAMNYTLLTLLVTCLFHWTSYRNAAGRDIRYARLEGRDDATEVISKNQS